MDMYRSIISCVEFHLVFTSIMSFRSGLASLLRYSYKHEVTLYNQLDWKTLSFLWTKCMMSLKYKIYFNLKHKNHLIPVTLYNYLCSSLQQISEFSKYITHSLNLSRYTQTIKNKTLIYLLLKLNVCAVRNYYIPRYHDK